MGGSLSHEYLYPSETGEDTVISCTNCSYISNLEAAVPRAPTQYSLDRSNITVHHSITADRTTLVSTYYLKASETAPNEVNTHRIKDLVPDLDPSIATPLDYFHAHFRGWTPTSPPGSYSQIINLFDGALPPEYADASFSNHTDHPVAAFMADKRIPTTSIRQHPDTGALLSLLKTRDCDACPRCETGTLRASTAVEIAHTFHLGTRYSHPLGAAVFDANQRRKDVHMGCHGIGLSRLIPALAQGYRTPRGLGWPRVVAPWEVAVIAYPEGRADAEALYDLLVEGGSGGEVEAVVDDRDRDLVWKMKDADLVGYPVFCVLGRSWKKEKKVEVQCPRKDFVVEVPREEVRGVVEGLLREL